MREIPIVDEWPDGELYEWLTSDLGMPLVFQYRGVEWWRIATQMDTDGRHALVREQPTGAVFDVGPTGPPVAVMTAGSPPSDPVDDDRYPR